MGAHYVSRRLEIVQQTQVRQHVRLIVGGHSRLRVPNAVGGHWLEVWHERRRVG